METILVDVLCDVFLMCFSVLQMAAFWPKETSCQMVVKAERDEQPDVAFSCLETYSFLLKTVWQYCHM